MSYSPQFYSLPVHEVEQINTANTARDGSGSVTALVTGSAPGVIIEAVSARAAGTTTGGMLRLFFREAATDTWRLISELNVGAITPSATAQAFSGSFVLPASQLYLPNGAQIGVSTHNAETFNVTAMGGRL